MANYPNDFVPESTLLDASGLKPADAELIRQLAEKDFEVHAGLTPALAGGIAGICLQPSIKEYCPNDAAHRFTDLDATKEWLGKGRAAFVLLKKEADGTSLAGYGWTGSGTSPHAPGRTTFALRIAEAGQGQGLATPFSRLIIAGSAVLYGARDIWLETWASNGAAVHIYHKLGFQDTDQVESERSTADGSVVKDTRLFMTLPNEQL